MQTLLGAHACDWHGEELPHRKVGHSDCWVVDPQDGTTAFQRGMRGSSVSVALMRQGKPVLGVVYAPVAPDDAGDLFVWAEGLVPMRNGQPMAAIGPHPAPYEPMEAAPWPAHPASPKGYDHATLIGLNEEAGHYALHNHGVFAPAGVLAIPSIAYRLALAAAGEVDAAVSLTSGLDSYDIGAGHALLLAVGGTLCELNGTPITYGQGRHFYGCIGGRPEIVQMVQERGPSNGSRELRHVTRPAGRTTAVGPLRRAQGALLGLLVGDALGSQVEFLDPARILSRYPGGLRDLLPGGTWNLLAGQPTDDGEMALALARSLVASGGFDCPNVAAAYINWKGSNPFDIGQTTAKGIDALRDRGSADCASQANGALMRVAPIGIAAAGDPSKAALWARQDAALTHPHPVCVAASAAFAAAIAVGVAGANQSVMWAEAYAHAGNDAGGAKICHALLTARDSLPPDFTRNQGWVLTAFGNAFHRLWREQDFSDALVETVMSGGDCDTNAAIAGALLGAAYGREAIPQAWRSHVLACRAVRGAGVVRPRPSVYWADDAMDLAEALFDIR
ncbi:MAG: inositol monophosphatase family protein [Pseudorhodobacter sp.]|nr:inositol monophosphatase family protein [Pseudorhodobacter sp.]